MTESPEPLHGPRRLLREAEDWTALLAAKYGYVQARDAGLRLVPDALITRTTFPSTEHFTGAVYDSERRLIRSSLRLDPQAMQPIDPETLPESRATAARHLPKAVYGGILFLILGHFLFESAARLWLQLDFPLLHDKGRRKDRPLPVVFHPSQDFNLGVFGTYPFFRESLAAFGVRRANLVLAEEDLRVDLLYYPEPLSIYHEYVHPLMGRMLDHLIETLGRPRSLAARWTARRKGRSPARIYLSRSRWHENLRIANERALEEVFRQRGFAIVHPQDLAPHEVIRLMQGADLVASSDGSHAHLLAFSKPGTCSLHLDTRPVPTQAAIERLRQLRPLHVPLFMDPEGIWDPADRSIRLDPFASFLDLYLAGVDA